MREFVSESFRDAELEHAQTQAILAATAVEATLRSNFGHPDYSVKDGDERSWVTQWDRWAQEVIIDKLSVFDATVGFKAEEDGVTTEKEVYWTIDPIDGTSHFVRGNDFCTSMIALIDHGKPVVSVVNDFVRGVLYFAATGKGAYRYSHSRDERQQLQVSTRPIEVAYVEMYSDEASEEGDRLRKTIEAAGAYLLRTSAAGSTLVSVAKGSTEGFISVKNPWATEWDMAPGVLLIHEAGGIVCNLNSDDFTIKDPDFIAANPVIFPVLKTLAQSILAKV